MTPADRPTTVAEAVEAGARVLNRGEVGALLPLDMDVVEGAEILERAAAAVLSAVGYADLLGEIERLRWVESDLAHARSAGGSYLRQRDALAATVARVETLADGWNEAPPRLADLATTRSADGDDSLTRALAIGRAYATALRAALSEPTEGDVSRDH